MKITTIGIDLAKNVFQAHGVDQRGKAVLKKRLRRNQVLAFFVRQAPCLIGMEACGGEMEKTVRANEHAGVTAGAIIVAILGLVLLFAFPVGTILGVILLIAAPRIANRSKSVWACNSCGYFFERV